MSSEFDLYFYYGCIILSAIGSTLMLVYLLFFDVNKQFAKKLILCLTISDVLYSYGLLMYVQPPKGGISRLRFYRKFNIFFYYIRCIIQGSATQIAVCSSCFWSTSIAYFSFRSTMSQKKEVSKFEEKQILLYIIGFGLPLLTGLAPFFQRDTFNPTPSDDPVVCSIRCEDVNLDSKARISITIYLNLFLFYMPVSIAIITSCSLIVLTVMKIRSVEYKEGLLNKQQELLTKFTRNLIIYPFILIICWLVSFVDFFISTAEWSASDDINNIKGLPDQLRILQYGLSFLQGFFDSLAYVWNIYQIKKMINELEKAQSINSKKGTLVSPRILNSRDSISSSISNLENFQDL